MVSYPEICLGDKYWRLLKVYALAAEDVNLGANCRSDYEATGKSITIDLSGPGSEWDIMDWDVDLWAGATIIVGRKEIDKGTEMFQLKFENGDVNEGFTILGYSLYIEPTDGI